MKTQVMSHTFNVLWNWFANAPLGEILKQSEAYVEAMQREKNKKNKKLYRRFALECIEIIKIKAEAAGVK